MNLRAFTPLCSCLWVLAVSGLTTGNHARAEGLPTAATPGDVSAPAPSQPAVVQGAVTQYLMNPDGVVDGLLLADNTLVRFPPHLGTVLAATVTPRDVVRVEGVFETPGTLHAASVVNLQNQRAVADLPPPGKRPPPPHPGSALRQPLSVQGTIRVLTRAKHGEVDGAVLANGTILRFPPQEEVAFLSTLHEGSVLAATGHGTTNEYGQSLEVEALGPSLAQLQPVAARPGPTPPPEGDPLPRPQPRPGDRSPTCQTP